MSGNGIERCRFRPPQRTRVLIWEVIDYCNLQCLHCCTDSGPWLPRKSAVTTEIAIRLLRNLLSVGVSDIVFSGGEPFFRTDFVEMLEAADSSTLEMFVNTNGYLVSRETARRVASAGLRRLTISLDGHNAEVHNRIRKHPKAFRRAVNAISECVDAGVPVRVSGVITPDLVDHVEEWIELVYSLGARVAVLNTMFPVGRGAQNLELVVRPRTATSLLGWMRYVGATRISALTWTLGWTDASPPRRRRARLDTRSCTWLRMATCPAVRGSTNWTGSGSRSAT